MKLDNKKLSRGRPFEPFVDTFRIVKKPSEMYLTIQIYQSLWSFNIIKLIINWSTYTFCASSLCNFQNLLIRRFCPSFPMDLLPLVMRPSSQWKVTDAARIELQVIRYAEPVRLHKSNFWENGLDSLQNTLGELSLLISLTTIA